MSDTKDVSQTPAWKRWVVKQRRDESGCIPAGYEMLLREARVEDIDLDSFQDDFDLDRDRAPDTPPRNNFESVAATVTSTYPHIVFRSISFNTGAEKLAFIEHQMAQGRTVLVSVAMWAIEPTSRCWHIMPLLEIRGDDLLLQKCVREDGKSDVIFMPKADLVRIHDDKSGREGSSVP